MLEDNLVVEVDKGSIAGFRQICFYSENEKELFPYPWKNRVYQAHGLD
jgi:hypothetical protein